MYLLFIYLFIYLFIWGLNIHSSASTPFPFPHSFYLFPLLSQTPTRLTAKGNSILISINLINLQNVRNTTTNLGLRLPVTRSLGPKTQAHDKRRI